MCGAGELVGMMMLRPGWMSTSGTLPAASRSKTLSASLSRGDLCGGAGSGLCRSEGVGGLFRDGEASGMVAALRVGLDNGGSAPSGLISFPWRELGGGGFFFTILGAGWRVWDLVTSPRRSSSTSDVSPDVWGVSRTICNASIICCRGGEDRPATLVPSLLGTGGDFWVYGSVPVCPVINNLPNAPTSSAPLAPGAEAGLSAGSATPASKSRSVF